MEPNSSADAMGYCSTQICDTWWLPVRMPMFSPPSGRL